MARPPDLDLARIAMTAAEKREPGRPRKRAGAASGKSATPRKRAPRKPRAKAKEPVVPEELSAEASPRRSSLKWFLIRKSLKYGTICFLIFLALSSAWIAAYRYINPPLTPLMLLRNVQEEEDVRKRWRDYDEISPEFLLAVISAEDQLFFRHKGFDLKQIWAAIEERLDGGRLRGGSTISQQVAKNVFLWPGRSWIRKGLEVWFTTGIELCWSKQRILEVYVNIAEMGQGIYGVEAAAQFYYHKPASALTREESALLVTVLPNPRERSPLDPTAAMRERQAWVLKQMHNLGGVNYLVSSD